MKALIRLLTLTRAQLVEHLAVTPATYTSVFDDIRDLFASTNEAKVRGYNSTLLALTSKVAGVRHAKGTVF